jgi:predicted enzyme related to lactoylglutathione lyase
MRLGTRLVVLRRSPIAGPFAWSEHSRAVSSHRCHGRAAGLSPSAGVACEIRAEERWARAAAILPSMPAPLIEFPADDPDRARRFWHGVLGVTLAPRPAAAGNGWQTDTDGLRLGVHERGPGPGDTASLPYFTVADLTTTLERVRDLGGSIIHPGDRWAVCRDSEGSPFALAAPPAPGE